MVIARSVCASLPIDRFKALTPEMVFGDGTFGRELRELDEIMRVRLVLF